MTTTTGTRPEVTSAVADLIRYLETGTAPDGLFAADVFADVTLPQWRLQGATAAELIGIRQAGHPCPGQVRVTLVQPTERGFVMEFEERWDDQGQSWYCREMIRADLVGSTVVELAVYCTGDWDEARQRDHAAAVRLIRP